MSGSDFAPDPAQGEEVDWLESEAGQHTLRRELQRLGRRARRRPILIVLLSLLGVGAVLWKLSTRNRMFQATIVMRVSEGNVTNERSPLASQGLAHYLYTVALNAERLMPIIEGHDLYPERESFGDLYAIDELRDHLDIEVGANFFATGRDPGDPGRSVGIRLHFMDFDPDLAFDVAQDLSAALVDAELQRRARHAEKLTALANTTVDMVESRLTKLNSELAALLVTINEAEDDPDEASVLADAKVRKRRLREKIAQTNFLLERVNADRDQVALAQAAEGARQALRFDIMDVRKPIVPPRTSALAYTILGLFVFLCLLPLSAIGIGALDTRLHHIEDLVRLDLPVVGHLPGFPSDRLGAMAQRSRNPQDIA